MSIGKKLLFAVTVLILFAFLTTLLFSVVVFRNSFLNLEKRNLESDVTRAANALSAGINKLTIDTQGWAIRDDTYSFAQIGNPGYDNAAYIKNNFADLIFDTKKINLMVIIDADGHIIHGKYYDLNAHIEADIPEEIVTYVSAGKILQNTDESTGISGVILLKDMPMIISAQPILTNQFKGPSAGTIVFGTLIDSNYISTLSQMTQTSTTIWLANKPQMTPDVKKASDALSASGGDFTLPLDSKVAAGYTVINDVFGKPAIILRTTSPRDVYNQGRFAVIFLFAALALTSILFGLLFILIMRKTVLERFNTLAAAVGVIGSTGDVSKPITIPPPWINGKDEITDLTANINNMMSKIGQTEANFITQKNLFERLLLYTPEIIFVVDGDGKISMVNKAFCTLFNVREENATGKRLRDFFAADEVTASVRQINSIEGSVTNYVYRPKIGKIERILDITIITVNPNEYLLIGRDITSEREEQERLYLNDRLASVGEMAAGLAHELNNPLTGIVMLSQLLMQTDFPPEVKKDLSDINSEASRATDVVRNLLAFARKQPPAKRLTQINKVVNDVLRLRHYEETVNNISVVTTLDPDLPEIMVDNIQIQQVFLNLILNAEYSMIKAHRKGQLEVDTSTANGKVVISFTDDGEGIKEEDMKKLFQPFFTTKQVGVGTGLGLSLCYGIVTRHGGTIYARSKYGSGVTFTVELPIDTAATNGDDSGIN